MKIVRIESGVVVEILPQETYELGIEHWYGADFATQCVEAPDNVAQGWTCKDGTFAAPVEVTQTPAQKRESEYETKLCIDWKGELITVNAAADLVKFYFAEGNTSVVTQLQGLIAPAKAAIRAEYPDVV